MSIIFLQVSDLIIDNTEACTWMQSPHDEKIDVISLRNVYITGGHISQTVVSEMKRFLTTTNIINCYGLTEAGNVADFDPQSQDDMEMAQAKPESCGRPRKGIWYKVVDYKTEKILGFNEPGEIRIKSESVMNGYYKMDSSSAWDSDGWLKTGDIGYYDEDLCFYITDRIKDVMIYRGCRVLPVDIERVLLAHPAVREAVVFGTPHEIHGDLPTALVVVKENYVEIESVEIEKFAKEHLHHDKKLGGGVKIVKRLLYTQTGKFRRHEMKKLYLGGQI